MRSRLDKRIAALRDEAGMTIVEVLVAAIVLVLGSAATFGILGAATKNAQRAKATQVALHIAQEELERLHGLPYGNLALSSLPTGSSDPLNPNHRVSGSQFALMRSPLGDYGTLVLDADNGFSPESEFVSGNPEASGVTGTLHRYVVWRNDPTCPDAQCPGSQDYKQLVVAVKPSTPGNQSSARGYVEVQSELIDPAAYEEEGEEEEKEGEEGGEESGVTAQQFFLSDTPCATGGTTTRQTIVADHLLHNTLGTCADGLQTGAEKPGAPDALLRTAPPDPAPLDESNPARFDYANDFYLEPTPDTDKGVQIRRDDTSGCHYVPTGATNPESQIHRWVTDPMPSTFQMNGKVTLEFYTRTLNDALYTGSLCVYLFRRHETGSPPVGEDTQLVDKANGTAHWVYEPQGNGYWPRNVWTRVRLKMEFQGAPLAVAAGDRLGVALGVDRANTPADAIPIMYDHPNYPTRIEVDTTTPLEGEGG